MFKKQLGLYFFLPHAKDDFWNRVPHSKSGCTETDGTHKPYTELASHGPRKGGTAALRRERGIRFRQTLRFSFRWTNCPTVKIKRRKRGTDDGGEKGETRFVKRRKLDGMTLHVSPWVIPDFGEARGHLSRKGRCASMPCSFLRTYYTSGFSELESNFTQSRRDRSFLPGHGFLSQILSSSLDPSHFMPPFNASCLIVLPLSWKPFSQVLLQIPHWSQVLHWQFTEKQIFCQWA